MKFQNKDLLAKTLNFLIYCKYYPEVMDNIMYFMIEEDKTLEEALSHFHCSSRLKHQMYKLISHQYHKRITQYNVHMYTKKKYGVEQNGQTLQK